MIRETCNKGTTTHKADFENCLCKDCDQHSISARCLPANSIQYTASITGTPGGVTSQKISTNLIRVPHHSSQNANISREIYCTFMYLCYVDKLIIGVKVFIFMSHERD